MFTCPTWLHILNPIVVQILQKSSMTLLNPTQNFDMYSKQYLNSLSCMKIVTIRLRGYATKQTYIRSYRTKSYKHHLRGKFSRTFLPKITNCTSETPAAVVFLSQREHKHTQLLDSFVKPQILEGNAPVTECDYHPSTFECLSLSWKPHPSPDAYTQNQPMAKYSPHSIHFRHTWGYLFNSYQSMRTLSLFSFLQLFYVEVHTVLSPSLWKQTRATLSLPL